MSKYTLSHDDASCIGCKACEVHCKTNKNLGAGPAPCKIITIGPVNIEGRSAHSFRLYALFSL
ncbi:MAG: hypothetical protein MZV63_49495 [Marinilabiliales bacterium]|nr:hypothetical protein [Marinilabiliales bacterium]